MKFLIEKGANVSTHHGAPTKIANKLKNEKILECIKQAKLKAVNLKKSKTRKNKKDITN